MSNLRQDLKKLKAKGLKKGSKKKFPDLSGDGKVTQKDILIGRGVVKKAVAGKLIKKVAQAIAKKKGKSSSLTKSNLAKSKEFKKFELGMDKYLNQTVAKKRYGTLPKFTSDAAKVTAGIALGAAAKDFEKAKKSKTVKGKSSQADIIGKGSPKGRAQGGSAPKVTKPSKPLKPLKPTPEKALDKYRKNNSKPKKKKDLIDEIQPDQIFTPGVKGPLRKVSKGGMMTQGQGDAIRGTKFKGTF